MMGYAAKDSLPFAIMGLLLMIGYSAAFMVLLGGTCGYDNDDDEDDCFDTFPHALGTLLRKGHGNFETDVSSARSQHFLVLTEVFLMQIIFPTSNFRTIWTALLYNSFVYIGPIVLMSLLVAILTDTHDRVRSKEEAQQLMHRLQATRKCAMVGGFVKW